MKRVILYAVVYGGIGAVVGVLMALYTSDVTLEQVTQAKQSITLNPQPKPEEPS